MNALAGGEADAFPAGYERVRSRMVHIHLKDAKCTESGRFQWVVMGEGEFDAAGQLQRLKEDGYETTVTLEPHLGSVDKTARAAKYLRRMMTEIGLQARARIPRKSGPRSRVRWIKKAISMPGVFGPVFFEAASSSLPPGFDTRR